MSEHQMQWLRNPINLTWLAMVAASLVSYTLGERMTGSTWHTSGVILVFALALAKGKWVIDVFMGLRTAPAVWRRVLLGWLIGLTLALTLVSLGT